MRGPGCTDACEIVRAIVPGRFGRSELLLHDTASHEAYGRLQAGPWPVDQGVVRTGALVIDRWARTVASFGVDVAVSEREWGILDYLAGRLDRFVSTAELTEGVWHTDWIASSIVTTTMARLRSRLSDAGHVIETAPGRGYRVRALPVRESPLSSFVARPWARLYARCVCCGSTASPHNGHGRCTRCQYRGHRPVHYGPCAQPPREGDADV
jgi:DNA-binding winged helix-turn-helix (wHTH) protein